VVIETDCLPILGMVCGYATPDLAMLRWIAYVKSLNPEIRHISGKDNAMVDMLSRARYHDEHDMLLEDEEVSIEFFEAAIWQRKERVLRRLTNSTKASTTGSGS
jgi:hypothetical protein